MREPEQCYNCKHLVRFDGFEYRHVGNSYCCLEQYCVCFKPKGKEQVQTV